MKVAGVRVRQPLGAATLVRPHLAAAKDKHKKKDSAESSAAAAAGKTAPNSLIGLPATDLTSDEAISHALNRLGFGPRPGDVDRVGQSAISYRRGERGPESSFRDVHEMPFAV